MKNGFEKNDLQELQLFALTEGEFQQLPVPAHTHTVHELFDDMPLGVYSSFRTFDHNKFLGLEDHLQRTEQSMRLLGWEYKLPWALLCRALHQICTAYPLPDSRVRYDVLAEPIFLNGGQQSRLLVALSPFAPVPASHYTSGVAVSFAPTLKRENPLVKNAKFVLDRRSYPLGSPQAYEYLLVNEQGQILECSSSNFYGVRDGVLWTANAGILQGITRKLILQIAYEQNIPVHLAPVAVDQIPQLDEASLSSSSRGIIPIVQIAGQSIAHGQPGQITQQLRVAYDQRVQSLIRTALETAQ